MPYSIKILFLLIKGSRTNPAPHGPNYNLIIGLLIPVSLIILSFCLFKSPILLLLFMISLSITPLLSTYPRTWLFSPHIMTLLEGFISFLTITKVLKYFFYIYHFWNNCLTLKGFKIFTVLLGLSFLYYLCTIRYIFFLMISNQPIPFSWYLLYLIGVICLFIRFMTIFSMFIIPFVFLNFPKYGAIMLTEIPEVEDLKVKPQPPSTNRFLGVFNYHSHRHNYPPEIPRTNFFNNFNRICLVTGLCLSSYACYHYRLQASAAMKAADAAVRAADAAEVQAGLMTKDEFMKRNPRK